MGHTNYWRSEEVDDKGYAAALKDIAKIVKSQQNILAGPHGDGKPELTNGISFNGIGSDSFETFFLPKTAKELQDFDFCKTGQKPYDVVVVAALARLAEVSGITISSDSRSSSEWEAGVEIASKALGRKVANPLSSSEPKPQAKALQQEKPKPEGRHLRLVKSFLEEIKSHYGCASYTGTFQVEATYSIKDTKAALQCVEYILETEAEDYGEQVKENGLTAENWDSINHVYVSACKAIGKTPDPEFFKYED